MKNILKTLGTAITIGAGTVIGWELAKVTIDTVTDPVKRAAIKRKVVNVKDAIFSKKEGQ